MGLILASGYTLARGADRNAVLVAITCAATALLAFTRVNPVWVLAAAAVVGAAGWA
jgi:chromate transport protein ChrA